MDPYSWYLLKWHRECKNTGLHIPSKSDMDETSKLWCGNSLKKNFNRHGCHLAVRQGGPFASSMPNTFPVLFSIWDPQYTRSTFSSFRILAGQHLNDAKKPWRRWCSLVEGTVQIFSLALRINLWLVVTTASGGTWLEEKQHRLGARDGCSVDFLKYGAQGLFWRWDKS